MNIVVGARSSPLSQAQLNEVLQNLRKHHPLVTFDTHLTATRGDNDQKTSLRTLEKTDFFTAEVDAMLLSGCCRIAIHSAKDLPIPLPQGITLIALTQCLDPSDSLVMRPDQSIATLPLGACVATSSERREDAVRQLREDLRFVDLRGTIAQRLDKLQTGEADAVVVAESALIRLGLTHLNRIRLPGITTQHQGQLAILAREDDQEMQKLFKCLDSRTRPAILYLGLEWPNSLRTSKPIIHYPMIQIAPRSVETPEIKQAFRELPEYTHLLFTSKSAVRVCMRHLLLQHQGCSQLKNKCLIAVGSATAKALSTYNLPANIIAKEEHAEGVIAELKALDLKQSYFFWPHSNLSRPLLKDFFQSQQLKYRECILYDTIPYYPQPLPNLDLIDEIVFTSPSTIDAFLKVYHNLPKNKTFTPIGPITSNYLEQMLISKS